MIRTRVFVLAAALAAAVTALPAAARDSVGLYVNVGPPPPRVEYVPASRPGYVWAPGYWNWNGHKHVWVKGHQIRNHHGERWVPERWDQHDGRWRLEHGHWSH